MSRTRTDRDAAQEPSRNISAILDRTSWEREGQLGTLGGAGPLMAGSLLGSEKLGREVLTKIWTFSNSSLSRVPQAPALSRVACK